MVLEVKDSSLETLLFKAEMARAPARLEPRRGQRPTPLRGQRPIPRAGGPDCDPALTVIWC